jgi:hypothetical protein
LDDEEALKMGRKLHTAAKDYKRFKQGNRITKLQSPFKLSLIVVVGSTSVEELSICRKSRTGSNPIVMMKEPSDGLIDFEVP